MKKVYLLIIFVISLFAFNSNIFAKIIAKSCYYNNSSDSSASQGKVVINIYDDDSATAVITMANGSEVTNKENVQNWNDLVGAYKSTGNCPKYVNMSYGGINGANVWVYNDMESAKIAANNSSQLFKNLSTLDSTENKDEDTKINKSENDPYDNGNVKFTQICNPNENNETLIAFRLVGIFVNIIKIIVPIILIVLGMIDMSKAVVDGKDDAIKKSALSILKRAIAGILIFFTPTIINSIFKMIDGWDNIESDFRTCMDCLTGSDDCPNVKFNSQYRGE